MRAVRRTILGIAAAAIGGALLVIVWAGVRSAPHALLQSTRAISTPSADGMDAVVDADWSPDRHRFAYVVPDASKGTSEVWIAEADGSAAHRAVRCSTPSCTRITDPAYSPDGRLLLVVEFHGAARARSSLVVVDLHTAIRHVIAGRSDGTSAYADPSWSPDGASVIVQRTTFRRTASQPVASSVIQVVGARTGRSRTLTPGQLLARQPDVRASDGLIVFTGEESDVRGQGLYTVREDGTALTRLTPPGPTRFVDPVWEPGGRRVSVVLTEQHGTNPGTVVPARAATVAVPTGRVELRP